MGMVKGGIRYNITVHTFIRGPACDLYNIITTSTCASVQLGVRMSIAAIHTQVDVPPSLRHTTLAVLVYVLVGPSNSIAIVQTFQSETPVVVVVTNVPSDRRQRC
jgi:hypothetical protein